MKIAYIDMQNIKLGIRELGREIDRKRFFIFLKMKFKCDIVKLFVGYVETRKEEYEYLSLIGYDIQFKKTYIYEDTHGQQKLKGNIDTLLMLHGILDSQKLMDDAVLVSGDGDFDVLIDYWLEKKLQMKIMIPNYKKASHLLTEYSQNNAIIYMDDLKWKIQKSD